MKEIELQLHNRKATVKIFAKKFSLQRHIYMHFLALCEPWSQLPAVPQSDTDRAEANVKLEAELKCKCSAHHDKNCTRFDECDAMLHSFAPAYLTETLRTLTLSTDPTAPQYVKITGPAYICLSPEGMLVFIHENPHDCEAVSAYFPHPFSPGTLKTKRDRFLHAVNKIYRNYLQEPRFRKLTHCFSRENWARHFRTIDPAFQEGKLP